MAGLVVHDSSRKAQGHQQITVRHSFLLRMSSSFATIPLVGCYTANIVVHSFMLQNKPAVLGMEQYVTGKPPTEIHLTKRQPMQQRPPSPLRNVQASSDQQATGNARD